MTRVDPMIGSDFRTRRFPGMIRAIVLSAGTLVFTACGTAPDRAAADDYPVFTDEATARDQPEIAHSDDLLADMDFTVDEVRWVGEYEATDFYAALVPSETDADEQVVCFFIAAHDLEVAGASCTADPYDSQEPTVPLRVAGTGGAVQAFLIPAAAELEDADGWHRASDNVVVLTNPAAQAQLKGQVAEDTDFLLRRITG